MRVNAMAVPAERGPYARLEHNPRADNGLAERTLPPQPRSPPGEGRRQRHSWGPAIMLVTRPGIGPRRQHRQPAPHYTLLGGVHKFRNNNTAKSLWLAAFHRTSIINGLGSRLHPSLAVLFDL